MTTVGKLLHDKGSAVWTTRPQASVYEALKLMADKDIGVLLVMDGEALVGILSERDCARKVILPGKNASETLVSDIMTARVLYVRADQSPEACMALMTEKHIRHLPVLSGEDRVLGVVSIGDLGRAIIAHLEFTIATWNTISPAASPCFIAPEPGKARAGCGLWSGRCRPAAGPARPGHGSGAGRAVPDGSAGSIESSAAPSCLRACLRPSMNRSGLSPRAAAQAPQVATCPWRAMPIATHPI